MSLARGSHNQVTQFHLDSYQERLENPKATRGLTTGLTALDDLLGAKGLVKQSLVVVGARPKCGKTAFYGMVAENCIVNEKKPALLFSLEMSGQLIFERLIGQNGNLNTTAFYEHDPDVIFHKYHTTQESLIKRFNFDLDACADSENKLCESYLFDDGEGGFLTYNPNNFDVPD